ncbi:hypothetical protein SeMB42_g05362 [Synchytrium endobioticum]|uniref:Uncharacterized protein n=1 Tax=Synchytrium endobioticum TaxID=286115 RepID=A0A507CRX3_9FUNG|nr:hypothetical protein SeMB42_g05362 [Synchytrium endobioticum]
MVKVVNLVIFLAAIITSIETAPVWDDDALMEATGKMLERARSAVRDRQRDVNSSGPDDSYGQSGLESYIRARIAKAVSKSIPSLSPFTEEQLLQEPNESMRLSQVLFIRAYHSLVFERLKTLFEKFQHLIEKQKNSRILNTGPARVAPYLLRHQDLERKWRERLIELCSEKDLDRRAFVNWRKLELPVYDWEHVHNIPLPTFHPIAQVQPLICDDATTGKMLQSLRRLNRSVVRPRTRIKRKGLPLNLQTDLGPTSYVITRIAQIRSNSRPFPFTETQLLEEPNASMPPDRLHLTRAYHRLVFEELKMIKYHFGANGNKGRLEQALAEVEGALQMHQILESKYRGVLERIQNEGIGWHKQLPEYDCPRLDSILCMQSPLEHQNYEYNSQPISDHGPGCCLEASTSQPRPWVVGRLKQPVLIDFLGIADAAAEATPGLAPRFGNSHDDGDSLSDDRFSNELRRPPTDNVGFVGGKGMYPDTSTGNIKRPCDSSLHGHQTTSNIRGADSPHRNTRFRLFGVDLGST